MNSKTLVLASIDLKLNICSSTHSTNYVPIAIFAKKGPYLMVTFYTSAFLQFDEKNKPGKKSFSSKIFSTCFPIVAQMSLTTRMAIILKICGQEKPGDIHTGVRKRDMGGAKN